MTHFWDTTKNPMADARELRRLLNDGVTQAKLAARLGCSRAAVANAVRLLCLPQSVQQMLERGELTVGHGRLLVAANDMEARALEWRHNKVSVREAEKLVKLPLGYVRRREMRAAKDAEKRRLTPQSVIVYFIQAGPSGPIKIGTTGNLRSRLVQLQSGRPEILSVLGARPGGPAVERAYHERFKDHRIRGPRTEWFRPATEIMAEAAAWSLDIDHPNDNPNVSRDRLTETSEIFEIAK